MILKSLIFDFKMLSERIFICELEEMMVEASIKYGNNHSFLCHYCFSPSEDVKIHPLEKIVPPKRYKDEIWFRNRSEVNALIKAFFESINLPPIEVKFDSYDVAGVEVYKVVNGFHRYYLSVAMGFTHIPVCVNNWCFEVP